MDEIDLILLKKLMEDSRVTYRELAEMTDMSISGIHKRIRSLEDDGIINVFKMYFKVKISSRIMVFGESYSISSRKNWRFEIFNPNRYGK